MTDVYEPVVTWAHGRASVGPFQHTKTELHHEAEEAEIKRAREEIEKVLGSSPTAQQEAEAKEAEAKLKKTEEEVNKLIAASEG